MALERSLCCGPEPCSVPCVCVSAGNPTSCLLVPDVSGTGTVCGHVHRQAIATVDRAINSTPGRTCLTGTCRSSQSCDLLAGRLARACGLAGACGSLRKSHPVSLCVKQCFNLQIMNSVVLAFLRPR